MANFGFSKIPRRENIAFFQSSLPYLNSHAVTLHSAPKTRRWRSGEPQASTKKILTFCQGNYGIYFSLFSQELRKKEHQQPPQDASTLIVILPSGSALSFVSDFYISKANLEILSDINVLKCVTRDWLSTSALVKPKGSLKQLYQARPFSTSAITLRQEEKYAEPATTPAVKAVEDEFEASFLQCQTQKILDVYNSHKCPSDLDIVYPLYQALKRNNLALSSVEEYNVLLKSIALRSVDSDGSIASTESKLSCLLTVYQDILQECCSNARCHPDAETYNVVLTSIFASTRQSILHIQASASQQSYAAAVSTASQFFQVGSSLFLSLSGRSDLSDAFLPDFLFCLNFFPQTMSKEVAEKAFALRDLKTTDSRFYAELIALAKAFSAEDTLSMSKKESYDFISSVFDTYKSQCMEHPEMAANEHDDVYASLIEALVRNDNLPVATKFLDQMLVDYKHDLESGSIAAGASANISNLLSTFVGSLMAISLPKAFTLLRKFNDVYYLPELSVEVYNDMINRFVAEYVNFEMAKEPATAEEINRKQLQIYTDMWSLYNRVAIRKDFQVSLKSSNCRESILSLSIDLGDHNNVSRLIKEIMVKNHAIRDWNVSKKLLQYLRNGAITFNNSYYVDLMWSVAEQQGAHYFHSAAELNYFLSHHCAYLIFDSETTLHQLMNSVMVFKAFEGFKLETHNIHGLMVICQYLMNAAKNTLPNDLFKVLQYQSYIINEFEDTENHYLDLSPEVLAFKQNVAQSFTALVQSQSPEVHVSRGIQEAYSSLGLGEISGRAKEPASEGYRVDLSAHLNANYSKGVERFLESFRMGYFFTDATWERLISTNFVVDVLEPEKLLSTKEFVQRLLASDASTKHLLSLIDLQNEKVNIRVLKFLISDQELARQEGVLMRLSVFAQQTNNKYFLDMLADNFPLLVSMNADKAWITNVFQKLNSLGKHSVVHDIAMQDPAFYLENADLAKEADESMLASVMVALLNLGRTEQIDQILRVHFSGPAGNKALLKSENLLRCLLEYYVSVGSYGTVVGKFASLASRSATLRQLVHFASLLSGFTGKKAAAPQSASRDSQNLALDILNEHNLVEMRNIYEQNKQLVGDKEVFLNQLVMSLTKSARLVDAKFHRRIHARFEAVIKFCKVLGLRKISTESLTHIIQFLSITRSTDLLSILFNKFVVGDTLVSTLNFFFLRVEIPTHRDAQLLLAEFKSALASVGDAPNMAALEDYLAAK